MSIELNHTIKGVEYEIRAYNIGRNEYDLIAGGVRVVDGRSKTECMEMIMIMADDKFGDLK